MAERLSASSGMAERLSATFATSTVPERVSVTSVATERLSATSAKSAGLVAADKVETGVPQQREMRLDDAAAMMARSRGLSVPDQSAQQVKPKLRISESGKFEDQYYHAHEGSRAMGRLRNRAYLKQGDKKDSGKKTANVNAKDVEQFSDADIVQSGYLIKQGSFWKTWKLRYFVLRRDLPVLSYYTSQQELTKLGEITIDENTTVTAAPKDGFPFRFIVEHQGRRLTLRTDNHTNDNNTNKDKGEAMSGWITSIEGCIKFRKDLASRASGSFNNRRSGSGDSFRARLSENSTMVDELLNERLSIPRQPNSIKRHTTDSVTIQKAAAEASAARESERRKDGARRTSRLPSVVSAPIDEDAKPQPPRLYRSRSAGSVLSRIPTDDGGGKGGFHKHDDNGVSTLLLANHSTNLQSMQLARATRGADGAQLTRAPSLSLLGFKPPPSIELAISVGSKGAQEYAHMMVILSSVTQSGAQLEICRTEMQSTLSLRSCGGDFYARDFSALLSVPRNAKRMLHFEIWSVVNPNSESTVGQKSLGFARISPLDLQFSRDSTIVLECHSSSKPLLFLVMERILPGKSINVGHAYTYAKRYFIADTAVMEKRKSGELTAAGAGPSSLGANYREFLRGKVNSLDANHVLVSEELSSSYISVSMTVAFLNFLQRRNLERIDQAKTEIDEFKKQTENRTPNSRGQPTQSPLIDADKIRDVELEMTHYMRLYSTYAESQKRYQALQAALEEGKEQGITGCLKRSNMKKDKLTEFMPTNLNCHLVRARRVALSNGGDRRSSLTRSFDDSDSGDEKNTSSSELVYAVTTHGCAAAHSLGFKEGGLRRLQQQLQQTPNDGRLRERIEQREDVVRCQVLAIAGSAFLSAVGLAAAKGGSHYERLELICSTGFLLNMESLLSTVGAEKGMLEDMAEGVRWLSRSVNFQVLRSIEQNPRLKYSKCVSILSTPTGDHIDVAFAVPSDVFVKLPVILQEGHAIKVHAVMFTQGINEMQSVANHYLNSSLQDELNSENADMLERYFRVYQTQVKFLADQKKFSSRTSGDASSSISEDLYALQCEISTLRARLSSRSENVQKKFVNILIESSDICRRLGAGRTTCCKSGKDRTAMSVTLETSRLLVDHFHVKQGVHLCNAMRERGVRRVNVLANTGKDKYAFNSFQLKYIPDCYKPPVASADSHVAS